MITAVVVGAGPFGLSIAAHFRHFGVEHRIFGRPVQTWAKHMPTGMILKSDGFASNLSFPGQEETLRDYCRTHGLAYDDPCAPISLATFVAYAKHVQLTHVPWLEQLDVTQIWRTGQGFSIRLEDGTTVATRTVIMATGITYYQRVPDVLRDVAPELATHSSVHSDLSGFRGKRVAVVGAGASAVGLAALLHEGGAAVALISRSPDIKFSSEPSLKARSIWQKLRHPSSGLGPGLRSRLASQYPNLFRYLPASLRLKIVKRHLGPSSPWYLRSRVVGKVNILVGHSVAFVKQTAHGLELHLAASDGGRTVQIVDHVISATGYDADINRLAILDGQLRDEIVRCGTMPDLNAWFESSVKGLYFTGLAASASFGPLMRFMYGSSFAAKRIARHVSRGPSNQVEQSRQ